MSVTPRKPQRTAEVRLSVARMTAGLRHALCKKEIQDIEEDERLRFFQKEDAARRVNWIDTEEAYRERCGKNNRAQIRGALGCRLSAEFKKQGLPKLQKPTAAALDLLGCDIPHFFLHIERQFREGMGWHNFGKWVLDHILPCSSFNFWMDEHVKLCFHFSNLQPLWALENMIKAGKIYDANTAY